MNTREQLNQYLRGLESRLRLLVVSRGVAVALGVALGATVALVLITNALAFSDTSVAIARVVLFIALAVSLGFALVIPLLRLNRRGAAGKAEAACPEFDARLVTYVERSQKADPFIDLLAADTMERVPHASAVRVIPPKSIFAFATSAGAAAALLLWLILAAPGYMGYGASLLWAGPPKIGPDGARAGSYYQITVDPGDKLVRRRSDLRVTATLSGFQAPLVRLLAKYKSSAKWEEAPMLPRANGTAYEFLFPAIPEPVEYYVEAAGVKSKTFKIDVIDLPSIKKVKVTYHFPSWLGMRDLTEDPGGDLRAVAGTVADLNIETDRPLKNGIIEMEDGSKIKLEQRNDNFLSAKVTIQKDAIFHYAANENGESVRLSEDYFIEAREDGAPSVKIIHPGSDAKVSPIEEASITVEAQDDFGLSQMNLHYSVNGAPEKVVSLLSSPGVKAGEGKTTLYLEEFKMQPGDVIAMYATAKDARIESKTDIAFIEAQPFEKNYSQSQQMGGGGGGGGGQQDQEEISRRQKEIIAATWNAVRGGVKDRSASAENASFLAEVQAKLKAQAESLAQRATSRQLAGANQEFQSFTKDMMEAAAQMGPASEKLKAQKWQEALVPEQKALQYLLRAEATFRDIQVAFGNQGGGGGGGGGSAGRDLANLFDLELDTEKNQYEQGQSGQSSAEQRQKEVDEALQKLEQLARRQQELAQQQRNSKQQSLEQRYQQELLRRQAEELKKQMEQLSQQQQSGQLSRNSQSQSQSGQSGQGGQSGQSGKESSQQSKGGQQGKEQQQDRQQPRGAQEKQLQSALDRIRQATDDMRAAQQASQNGQDPTGQSEANARRAAERLQEARDMVNNMRRQDASSQLGEMGERADKIAQQQKDTANRLTQAYGTQAPDPRAPKGANPGGPGMNKQQANELASEKEQILAELDKLEKDMQRSARELGSTQPNAAARLREGLAEIQQNEAKLRLKYQADYIRQGMGQYMVPREAPITQTLDRLREDIRQAQQAMTNADQQARGATDLERQLSRVERMRQQAERMAGRDQQGNQQGGNQQGKQGGQQQGGGKEGGGKEGAGGKEGGQGGKEGGQQAGNQQGGGNQGGGQMGGNRNGGNFGARPFGGSVGTYGGGANGPYDPRDYFGRYNPEGVYQAQDTRPQSPQEMTRDFSRELAEMRQQFRDDPDVSRQIADLQSEITKLNFGDPSGPELQQRLSRTILPQLETLEVQLRRQAAEEQGGQVRSGASDRVPPGYVDSVAEYFRKLSRGR